MLLYAYHLWVQEERLEKEGGMQRRLVVGGGRAGKKPEKQIVESHRVNFGPTMKLDELRTWNYCGISEITEKYLLASTHGLPSSQL